MILTITHDFPSLLEVALIKFGITQDGTSQAIKMQS